MSLILDALKRAERERQAIRSPVLGEAAASAPPRRSRRPLLAIGAIAVVIAVGVTWFVVRKRSPRPPVTVAQPAQPMPAPVPPQARAPALPQPQAAPPPAVVRGTEGVASLEDLTGPPPEPGEPGSPPVESPRAALKPAPRPAPAKPVPAKPGPAPKAAPPAATPAEHPAPTAAAPVEETPAPEDTAPPPKEEAPAAAPTPAARPSGKALPPALTQQVPMRRLREMPADYRAAFPQISIDVHNYDKDESKRFVLINGHRYHEGERIAEGPQIAEIVRDGVIFDFRGEKVLFPLGR